MLIFFDNLTFNMWSGPCMALSASLGADGPMCSAERGFGRAGQRVATHPPWPATARAGSSTFRNASAAPSASILRDSRQHTSGTFSPHGYASSRPAEASGGPICGPLPGGLQGSKNFHHPGGPKDRHFSGWVRDVPAHKEISFLLFSAQSF
jgi:hypothetical protein